MELNYRQQLIVIGVLQYRSAAINKPFAGADDAGIGLSRWARQRRRLAAYDAQAGLVPMRLSCLLGHASTPDERVRFHREYARLEAMGLLERHYLSGGRRATHLRLTETGQRVAETLLAEKAAANDIAAADTTNDDGFPLLQELGWAADCLPEPQATPPSSPEVPPTADTVAQL